jgi:hypothetical protein
VGAEVRVSEVAVTYGARRFDLETTRGTAELGRLLNGLEGEGRAVVPNVAVTSFRVHPVDFVLVVEKLASPVGRCTTR